MNRLHLTGLMSLLIVIGACDTGDGKTMREPTGTLPPTTSTTLVRDGLDTLASLPLDDDVDSAGQLPAEFDGDDFRVVAPWVDGAQILPRHTCDESDVAPALSWVDAPEGAIELAVVMVAEDDGGNDAAIHWVLAGLDPTSTTLVEGAVPPGAVQATNDLGTLGWSGPCPSVGTPPVTYRFTVFALGQQIEFTDGVSASEAVAFIEAVAFASSDLRGTYQR